jgi:hypothetical protein
VKLARTKDLCFGHKIVTTLDGRETEIEIVATKAQKLRWKVGNEFQNFENFFFGVHKEFALLYMQVLQWCC